MNWLDAIYLPVAALLAPLWMRKRRADWRERFGHVPALPPPTRPRLLLHAVSVGEVSALRHLVPLLTPSAEVIISAGTDTGIARARDLFGASCHITRYPLDLSRSVRRFLNAIRPDAVALVELELWPNFVNACARRGTPIAVINGRLSARSFRGYRKLRFFLKRVFGLLRFAAVQDEAYADRFRAMGVAPEKCLITGSMKWDAARIEDVVPGADDLARELGIDLSRPLIVAGSTGPLPGPFPIGAPGPWSEEALLHRACPPGTQLLCAPRKPERFNEAAAAMPGCARRTDRPKGSGPGASADRFLLDTIGELRHAYALADVVVMGRSFGDLYGSDPIEPVALGKPTVIGPAVSDFSSIVAEFDRAGGLARASIDTLARILTDLVHNPGRRAALAKAGRSVVLANRGASRRHADLLLDLVQLGASRRV